MLSRNEVRERALFCCCVFLQLSWLHANGRILPADYLQMLEGSSLHLGKDPFIRMTLHEAGTLGDCESGLRGLIHLYEGFTHALCEVLETEMRCLAEEIPRELLHRIASEVGMEALDWKEVLGRL